MSESNEQALRAINHLLDVWDDSGKQDGIRVYAEGAFQLAIENLRRAAQDSTPQPQMVREALEKAINICLDETMDWNATGHGRSVSKRISDEIRALIAPLSAADSVAVQEPVAWRYNRKMGIGGVDVIYTEAPPEDNPTLTSQCVSVDPLYAAPTLDKEPK